MVTGVGFGWPRSPDLSSSPLTLLRLVAGSPGWINPMPMTRFKAGVAHGDVDVKTASATLTEADNGKLIVANAVDLKFTLPPTKKGLVFQFLTLTASATTGLQIDPDANDKIVAKGITAADNKDLINSAASDAVGDTVTLVGDGVDGWYVVSMLGTWAREA